MIQQGEVGDVLLLQREMVQSDNLNANTTSETLFVIPAGLPAGSKYVVAGVTVIFGTASSSGTLQIEVAQGTTATGSGVNQLTGTVNLAGSANTSLNGTVIAKPTQMGVGDRLNVILGGTLTSLANCMVTVLLQKVS